MMLGNHSVTERSTNVQITETDNESDYELAEQKTFILAPTPAQLGRAPLHRRLNTTNNNSQNSNDKHFAANMINCTSNVPTTITSLCNNIIATSMASSLPTPSSAGLDEFQNQISPSLKKSFCKRAKTDDMDK